MTFKHRSERAGGDVRTMRWRWWLGLALLLAAVAAGVAFRRSTPAAEPMAPLAGPIGPGPSAAASGAASASASAALTATLTVSGAAQPAASSPYVDVCGHGLVLRAELEPQEGSPPPAWAQALDRQMKQSQAQLLKRLDAGPAPQRVAAALLREDVQAAAELAAQTDDAIAYQLALRGCRKDGAHRAAFERLRATPAESGASMPELPAPGALPTACGLLSLERMEVLRPDDAWPALVRLSDARGRRDVAATGQALHQLASRSWQAYGVRPLSAVLAEVVGAEPTAAESLMLMNAEGLDIVSSLDASPLDVNNACRPPQLADANRRQLCEQVAHRLPDVARDFLHARLLHSLEDALGLPHSPQSISKTELQRLQESFNQGSMDWTEEPTCANFSRSGRRITALARDGELAYARGKVKARDAASAPR